MAQCATGGTSAVTRSRNRPTSGCSPDQPAFSSRGVTAKEMTEALSDPELRTNEAATALRDLFETVNAPNAKPARVDEARQKAQDILKQVLPAFQKLDQKLGAQGLTPGSVRQQRTSDTISRAVGAMLGGPADQGLFDSLNEMVRSGELSQAPGRDGTTTPVVHLDEKSVLQIKGELTMEDGGVKKKVMLTGRGTVSV